MRKALRQFLASESAGGVVLGIAALLALIISNSPWAAIYEAFVKLPGELRIGPVDAPALLLAKPLIVWVNDLWMAVFFFLVGLEIKRELLAGELSNRAQAMLPAVAALGGMVVPALIYVAFNHANPQALRGWAIPSATDIAFSLGVVMLMGPRVPISLKVFLTAVAIFDDLGAILVIAVFYTEQLSLSMLALALCAMAVLAALNKARVMRADVYILVGLIMWLGLLKSGVHATLAGVATALFIPMQDSRPGHEGQSPLMALEHGLHPWVAFVILPMFAFANAGVSLAGITMKELLAPLPLGIAAGLLAGKAIGVFGSCWLMIKLGLARKPSGSNWGQFFGVCVLCGIGFTMSLFIGGLAFEGLPPVFEMELKLGVIGGSLLSGVIGAVVLARSSRRA
ncbi:Na+/H+ antiporter NhaA [Burkholderiaceae bacterium UC74_6]